MNVELYPHDDGYRVVATNAYGESEECVLPTGHPVSDYVTAKARLNVSYLVYWLTEQPSKATKPMLEFLNNSNDHRRVKRKTRPKGWRETAGLSTGEVPHKPQKDGDVVVHGTLATMTGDAQGD